MISSGGVIAAERVAVCKPECVGLWMLGAMFAVHWEEHLTSWVRI